MATDAQIEANRVNAAKSTGPRTGQGKRRAASNAQKHGLSMPPPSARVLVWYNCIVDSLKTEIGQLGQSDLQDAAMALAEAEASLERARNVEEDFLWDLAEDRHLHVHLRTIKLTTREIWWLAPNCNADVERILLALKQKAPDEIHHKTTERWTEAHVHHARLVRYRRDAEVRRHKALRAWVEELETRFSRTNPNTTQDCGS